MKAWTIVINVGNKRKNIYINEKLYIIFIIFIGILSSFFFYLNIEGYKKRMIVSKANRLKEEKVLLLSKLEDTKYKLSLISKEVSNHIFTYSTLLSYLSDIEVPKDYNLMMGTGGFFEKISINDNKVSGEVENLIIEKERMKNIISFEDKQIKKSETKLTQKENLLHSIPSIFPTHGYITAGYGYRTHPIYKTIEFHKGIDIANHIGTNIYSTAYGVVKYVGWKNGYGLTIIIDHGYGYSTKYAHLNNIYVKNGDYVKRGSLIGSMGSSGLATGPHLHYEVLILGNPTNPWGYLEHSQNTY